MSELYGQIQAVSTVNAGEDLAAPMVGGETLLPVGDISTFSPDGGLVLINSAVIAYGGIDEDAESLVLVAPFPGPADEMDRVEVYPEAPEKSALVNLGDEGDDISVVVPYSFAPMLPDGFRENEVRENVLITERATGEYVITDIPGHPSLVGGAHLEPGEIDPSRLAVGVVTNLISDPTFLSGTWPQADEWEIVAEEPGGDYAGLGFLRSTTTGPHPEQDPYALETDNVYFLTPWNDIDFERVIRLECQVRGDVDSRTNTYTDLPTGARMRILFRGPSVPDRSGEDDYVEVTLVDSTDPGEWSTLGATFAVPEGYTSFRVMLDTAYQTAGAIDYIKPEVQVLWSRLQSPDYVAGESGFLFGDEESQVQDLQVINGLGASSISTNSLEINGVDIGAAIDALPRGVAGGRYARSYGVSTASIDSTAKVTHQFDAGDVASGRLYRFHVHGHLGTAGGGTNDAYDLQLNYTTDGSTPLISGGTTKILDGSLTRVNTGPQGSNSFNIFAYYFPGGDWAVTKFALVVQRVIGSGNGYLVLNDINRCTEFLMEDMGAAPDLSVANGGGGILSQKSKAGGGSAPPPDPDPIVTYTKTFYATWTRSYDGNKAIRKGDDGTNCYQGYYSGTHGNTRSLVGFDYGAIQSALSGATVKKVTITYKVAHSYQGSGMSLYMSSHAYVSKPGAWGSATVNEARAAWTSQKAGTTYTHTLSNTIGNEFKAGTTRGIGFGPGPSNSRSAYYGYIYGGSSSGSRPRITITYSK